MKVNILIYEHCKDLLKIIKEIQSFHTYIPAEKKNDLLKDLSVSSRFFSYLTLHTEWNKVYRNKDTRIFQHLLIACYDALLRDDFYLANKINPKEELKKLSYYKEV